MIGARYAALVLVAGLAPCGSSVVAQKPAVRLEFRLREASYLSEIDTTVEKRPLEDSVAAHMRRLFAEHLAFINFESDPRASHALLIDLDREPRRSTKQTNEVGFHAALLMGPDTSWHYFLTFREATAGDQVIGRPEVMLEEIDQRLAAMRDVEWKHLVDSLLIRVPITTHALVWKQPVGWIMPQRHQDLCLSDQSVLTIDNMLHRPFTRVPRKVKVAAGVFDPPLGGPPALDSLRLHIFGEAPDPSQVAADSIEVKGIYVSEYLKDRSLCPPPITPGSQTDFGSGTVPR